MSKKYQKNIDPDSSEEESQIEPLQEQSSRLAKAGEESSQEQNSRLAKAGLNKNLNQAQEQSSRLAKAGPVSIALPKKTKSTGRPIGSENKDAKELIFSQEQINNLILEKYGPKYKEKIPMKDIKKLVPPKPKYVMTDDDKARLRLQLERGRETIKKNKELKKQEQLKEVEKIRAKSIIVPNPIYVKKQHKKTRTKPKPRQETELYPDDTEETSETSDTREIRKTKEKIQLIKATQQPQVVKPYSQFTILEKLKSKF